MKYRKMQRSKFSLPVIATNATSYLTDRQRHSPYRRRTHCLYSSSMQMCNDGGHIRYSPFVVPLQRKAHSSPFRPKRRRSTWPFCSWDTVHSRTVWSLPRRRKATRLTNSVPLLTWPLSHLGRYVCQHVCIFDLIPAALAAGSVANASEVRKIAKYAELGRRFIFQPVAVETSGAMGKSTIQFFKDLGRRLAVRFQDQRESDFLLQRVSLAILRGDAFTILQSYRV